MIIPCSFIFLQFYFNSICSLLLCCFFNAFVLCLFFILKGLILFFCFVLYSKYMMSLVNKKKLMQRLLQKLGKIVVKNFYHRPLCENIHCNVFYFFKATSVLSILSIDLLHFLNLNQTFFYTVYVNWWFGIGIKRIVRKHYFIVFCFIIKVCRK